MTTGDLTVPCMSADERTGWDFWDARTAIPGLLPCMDCTAAFSDAMSKVGRCDGHPGMARRPAPFVPHRGRKVLDPVERQERRRASWRAYGKRKRARGG